MSDRVAGYLTVGTNDQCEVVVNHPDITTDDSGAGHIVFSIRQARHLAKTLMRQADIAEAALWQKERGRAGM